MDGIAEALRLVNFAVEQATIRHNEAALRRAEAFRTCLEAVRDLRVQWESVADGLGYRQSAVDKAKPLREAPSLHSEDVFVQPDELHSAVSRSGLPAAFSRVSAATEPLSRVAGEDAADRARSILRVLTDIWVLRDGA